MNALQLKNLKKDLFYKSRGKTTEYVAMVNGNYGVVLPASDKDRYKHYLDRGYAHVMSALDGDVLELF